MMSSSCRADGSVCAGVGWKLKVLSVKRLWFWADLLLVSHGTSFHVNVTLINVVFFAGVKGESLSLDIQLRQILCILCNLDLSNLPEEGRIVRRAWLMLRLWGKHVRQWLVYLSA